MSRCNKVYLWFKQNVFLILIAGYVVYQQFPVWQNNFQQKNRFIPTQKVFSYKTKNLIDFPSPNERVMAIFWASWCGPCKIEMNRLKKSVEAGSIPQNVIFAINPFESDSEIKKFLQNNHYPFQFIESSLSRELQIAVTPTTIFFDKGVIESMRSGMGLWGIWEAELFL